MPVDKFPKVGESLRGVTVAPNYFKDYDNLQITLIFEICSTTSWVAFWALVA